MTEVELQQQIDDAAAGLRSKTIEIPAGIHVWQRNPALWLKPCILLRGSAYNGITIVSRADEIRLSDGADGGTPGGPVAGDLALFYLKDVEGVRIVDVRSNGNKAGLTNPGEQTHCVMMSNCQHVTIESLTTREWHGDGCKVAGSDDVRLVRHDHRDNGRSGVTLHSGKGIAIDGLYGKNNSDQTLDMEPPSPEHLCDVWVKNVVIEYDVEHLGLTMGGTGIHVESARLVGAPLFAHGVHGGSLRTFSYIPNGGAMTPIELRKGSGVRVEGGDVTAASNYGVIVTLHHSQPRDYLLQDIQIEGASAAGVHAYHVESLRMCRVRVSGAQHAVRSRTLWGGMTRLLEVVNCDSRGCDGLMLVDVNKDTAGDRGGDGVLKALRAEHNLYSGSELSGQGHALIETKLLNNYPPDT